MAVEVYALISHTFQLESNDRIWALQTAIYPKIPPKHGRQIWADAKAIGDRGRAAVSGLEKVDDPQVRVEMIGGAIMVGGRKWLDDHPRQRRWLERIGVTPEQAVAAHQSWLERERGHDFWEGTMNDGVDGDTRGGGAERSEGADEGEVPRADGPR